MSSIRSIGLLTSPTAIDAVAIATIDNKILVIFPVLVYLWTEV